MLVQVLGTGCPKCQRLYAAAEQAIRESGVAAALEKVEDIGQIAALGVMFTPALAIDGQVKSSGKVLTAAEIARLLAAATESA